MGLRAVTLGHGYPAVAEAVAAQVTRGTNFVRPSRLEVEAAESVPRPRHARRDGQVHEGRLDRKHRRRKARARVHRARPRRPLRRPPLLLVRRLGDGRDAGAGRHPGRRRRADAALPLRRPRLGRGAARAAPRPNRVLRARARADDAAERGVPARGCRSCPRRRRAPRLRRERHGVPLGQRRGPAGARHHARPLDVGEGHRERIRALGARGAAGDHAARRARPRPGARVPPLDDPRGGTRRAGGGARHDGDVPRRAGDRDAPRPRRAAPRGCPGGGPAARRRGQLHRGRARVVHVLRDGGRRGGRRRSRSGRCSCRRRSPAGCSPRRSSSATRTRRRTSTGRSRSSTRPSSSMRRRSTRAWNDFSAAAP